MVATKKTGMTNSGLSLIKFGTNNVSIQYAVQQNTNTMKYVKYLLATCIFRV